MVLFFSFFIAMLITMALIPLLIRSADKYQFVDLPGPRKVHAGPIPRVGGIAMVAGTVLPVAMWLLPQREVVGFLVGLGAIVAFGVWDDHRGLDYKWKFAGQMIAVAAVMGYGHVLIRSVPLLYDAGDLPLAVAVPLTFVFILGITNAVNLSDGLDGLAGGTSLLGLGAMAILGYATGNIMVVLIAVAVVGSILGFLRFNTHPATIFMGDGGSQFLGFSAGVLAVLLIQHAGGKISPALPLLLMMLPILDTLMVMWQRMRDGRSPFEADKNHMHHKLLALGFSHYEAVLLIYIVQAGLVAAAYLLRYQDDATVLGVLAGTFVGLWAVLQLTGTSGWRFVHEDPPRSGYARLQARIRRLRAEGLPLRLACAVAAVGVGGYLAVVVATSGRVTQDIGTLAVAAGAVMILHAARHWDRPVSWVDQAAMYILGALAVFMAQTSSPLMAHWRPVADAGFAVLAAAILLGFVFSRQKTFELTTLDFLVIFAACTIPNLPHVTIGHTSLGACVVKLILLYYGTELLLLNTRRYLYVLRPLVVALFLAIGLRAIT